MSGLNHTTAPVSPTGDARIEGILGPRAWADAVVTYSFPTSATEYPGTYGSGEHRGFFAASAAQAVVVRFLLDTDNGISADDGFAVEGFTNLTLTETTEAGAHIRLNQTTLDPDNVFTAWSYRPHGFVNSGDLWFSNVAFDYSTPLPGNYPHGLLTHEIGHTLGLEHAHEATVFGTVPSDWDMMEFTLMTYRSYENGPLQYVNETRGFAQTFMMLDIAALQELYGANYSVNAGRTAYSWTPASGATLVNGEVAITPVANRIFATIWDGGGIDTYDLSAYTSDLQIDLAPGGSSLFSTAQQAALGFGNFARGNIYNALTVEDDPRSLIENATGGSGNDAIAGNIAANLLRGGAGADRLDGLAGEDRLRGQAGRDDLRGGTGTDDLFGGANRDRLAGQAGADTLEGGKGNDRLLGNSGHDTLDGGDGDDRLAGGAGADTMTGGAGSDTFVFSAASDAGAMVGKIDIITDFMAGTDRLDLSLLGSLALSINGAFSGTAAEVVTIETAGTTQVLVDLDADGLADMRIDLVGATGIGVGDFLL